MGQDGLITNRLKKAVSAVSRQGIIVTLATGRMFRSARYIARQLAIEGPIISYQGAMTGNARTGEILRHVGLNHCAARHALDIISEGQDSPPPGQLQIYVDDEIYAVEINEWAVGYQRRMRAQIQIVDSLWQFADLSPTLILVVDEPPKTAARVALLKSSLEGAARVTHSLPSFCEIAHMKGGKVDALDALARSFGIDRSDVVAVGDGPGDVEMIEWAGFGVAIEDGHEDAIAASDRVVAGPENGGVMRLLEKLAGQEP